MGIAIFPNEYDKIQVLDILKDEYDEVYYFGDKYEKGGNDYLLIEKLGNKGIKINKIEDTFNFLKNNILKT